MLKYKHDLINDKMTEGVFLSNAFTKRLREKQELEEGGNQLLLPLMTVDDTGSTGKYYAPRDNLPLTEYDGFSASVHQWKYLEESLMIYKPDIAKNAGKLGVLKLIDRKVRQAELALNQRLIKGVISDGTASTGALDANQFVGLAAIINNTSASYGGISSTDLSTWVSYLDTNGGTLRSLTQAIADKAYDQSSEDGVGAPTVGLYTKGVQTKFKSLLTAFQRTLREDSVSGLGNKGMIIVYNGIDHLVENNMPANTMWYVSEDFAKLHVNKDHNMRRQSIQDLETADALLERIFLYAIYASAERKFHAKIGDIST